jgi:hypothetical protein
MSLEPHPQPIYLSGYFKKRGGQVRITIMVTNEIPTDIDDALAKT